MTTPRAPFTLQTLAPLEDLATLSNTSSSSMVTLGSAGGGLEDAAALPGWVVAFDQLLLVTSVVGVVANLSTLITLLRHGEDFSPLVLLLLRYQSLLDAANCFMATLTFTLPPFAVPGVPGLDHVICALWHTQHLFWQGVFLSDWNLVTLAIERYICVCHPLKYHQFTKTKLRMLIVLFFVLSVVCLFPGVFQAHMKGDVCVNENYFSGKAAYIMYVFFALSVFLSFYVIPTLIFIVAYGLVIASFRRRARSDLGASGTASVVERASKELTKTAVTVTAIFVFSFSFDSWYFMLSFVGVTEYRFNSPMQKISSYLSLLNLVANPFVYGSLLPLYRRAFLRTYGCGRLLAGKSESKAVNGD